MESIGEKEKIALTATPAKWITPSEVLQLRKKARRMTVLKPVDVNVCVNRPLNYSSISKGSGKIVNPFRCAQKRKEPTSLNEEVSEDSSLWAWSIANKSTEKTSAIPPTKLQSSSVDPNFHSTNAPVSNEKKDIKREWQKHLPIDWSLKTKARFVSSKPFPWSSNLKTLEEASGTTGYARCLHMNRDNSECNLDTSPGARFYQQTLIWIHPSLPWLRLFPRMDAKHLSTKQSSASSIMNDSILQESILSDWFDSLCSLYQLVRARQCPYFYVCAPTFTVLFKASGVSSIFDIHALITPTTSGFRQALKDEGIKFTMPLNIKSESQSNPVSSDVAPEETILQANSSAPDIKKEGSSLEEYSDDEEPVTWLESLGLSQQNFPALNPKRIKLEKESQKSVDRSSQSLIYIEGAETHSLINFLLNSQFCISKIGPLAGVPPTLLSPVAFHGGTLKSLKVRHSQVTQQNQTLHSIEMSGPIIPSTIHGLCSLFNYTQEGHFSGVLASHGPTIPFTNLTCKASSSTPSLFATANLKDCGLSSSFVHHMCSKNMADKAINEIFVENKFFAYN